MEQVTGTQTSAAKRVPIKIVHSEGVTEKESCPFLQQCDPPAVEPGGLGVTRLNNLGAAGKESVFCTFTRQRETDSSAVSDHINSTNQKPPQPTKESSGNMAAATTRLSDDQKREELARDIMGKDRSLADILDQSKMRTTMDLMEGIFPQEEQLIEGAHQRRKVLPKQTVARPAEERSVSYFSFHLSQSALAQMLFIRPWLSCLAYWFDLKNLYLHSAHAAYLIVES